MELSRDVTAELGALLARNRGPDGAAPAYRVEASLVDESLIRLQLTFRAGASYCCAEAGCHLPLTEQGWAAVREALKLSAFVKLAFEVEVFVEAGARFLSLGRPRHFEASRASRYRAEYPEW